MRQEYEERWQMKQFYGDYDDDNDDDEDNNDDDNNDDDNPQPPTITTMRTRERERERERERDKIGWMDGCLRVFSDLLCVSQLCRLFLCLSAPFYV